MKTDQRTSAIFAMWERGIYDAVLLFNFRTFLMFLVYFLFEISLHVYFITVRKIYKRDESAYH